MRPTNHIVLATLNKGKIEEYKLLFKDHPEYQLKTLDEVAFNPSALSKVETGKTYYENAFLKAKVGHFCGKYPTISDDSGLEVDALSGRPGVFSDRYAEPKEGESKSAANIRKLLEELKGVPKEKRTAKFVCTVVFMVEGVVLTASESISGTILEAPRGNLGFGYDPIFLVDGTDKSFAELTGEEKNKISHRAKAFRALIDQIKQKHIQLVHP
ncbi:MAG: RdgB/HAM1 family non-canonical purine NTP pyrophosphatase [Bacteriovoracia bacterium]